MLADEISSSLLTYLEESYLLKWDYYSRLNRFCSQVEKDVAAQVSQNIFNKESNLASGTSFS